MAGNYIDPPGNRMAVDLDGTVGFVMHSADFVPVQMSQGQLNVVNQEGALAGVTAVSPPMYSTSYIGYIFPQQRTVSHFYLRTTNSGRQTTISVQVSPNSTNGYDGTWTTVATFTSSDSATSTVGEAPPHWRSNQTAINQENVKGIRVVGYNGIGGIYGDNLKVAQFHIYGRKTDSDLNRLDWWHPTLGQSLALHPAYLDLGNVIRGQTPTKTVRLKNRSDIFTASNIVLSATALTDSGTPTLASSISFSLDGGSTWATSPQIDSLSPGQVSGDIQVRLATVAGSPLSVWSQRILAQAGVWS